MARALRTLAPPTGSSWILAGGLAAGALAASALSIAVPIHLAGVLSSPSVAVLGLRALVTAGLLFAVPLLRTATGLLRVRMQAAWLCALRHRVETAATYHTLPDAFRAPGE
jgi:hypothetical protein